MMRHVITGGMQGITGGLAGKQLEKITGQSPYLADNGEALHNDIKQMVRCLEYLCHKEEDTSSKPIYDTIVLQPSTFISMNNENYHRNYNMALVAQSTVVQFKVAELGQAFSLTLQAGWNILNMPDYTQWALPSSATSNVTLRYCASNVLFGNAI